MATVKVKLRPSTVPGKAGTIYYQLTHLRQVKQITTKCFSIVLQFLLMVCYSHLLQALH